MSRHFWRLFVLAALCEVAVIASVRLHFNPRHTVGEWYRRYRAGRLTVRATVDLSTCEATGAPAAACTAYEAVASACANETFPSTGQIRYYCDCGTGADANCQVGADTNAGTSAAAPKRTISNYLSAFASAPAGSTFAFCRGGAWNIGSTNMNTSNPNTTSGSPILVRDYTPSGWTPAVDHQPLWNQVSSGSTGAISIFPGTVARTAGYRFLNIELDGNGGGAAGAFFRNGAANVELCNLTINGFGGGVDVAGNSTNPSNCYSAGPPIVNTCLYQQDITVHGSTITNNVGEGIFGACDRCKFDYNFLQRNGSDNAFDHTTYMGGVELVGTGNPAIVPAQNEEFIGNIIVDSGSGSQCDGAMFVMHGEHNGAIISKNSFIVTGAIGITVNCYAMGVQSGGYAFNELLSNITLDGNYVNGYATNGINVGTCQNCTLTNSIVIQGISVASDNSVGIYISGATTALAMGSMNITVANNTVYTATSDNLNRGIVFAGSGTGYIAVNNSIFFDNTTSGRNFNCFDHGLGTQALTGGTVSGTVSNFTGITDGAFDVTINGVLGHVTGINWSSATAIGDGSTGVAGIAKTRINAAFSGTNFVWQGTNFLLNTAARSSPTTITVASAPTTGGTDVSALLGLTSGAGAAATAVYTALDHNHCFAQSGPTMLWDQSTGDTLTAWKAAFSSFDAASIVVAPQFVNATTASTNDFTPNTGSPLIAAGTTSYSPAIDYKGNTRPSPPSIGAIDIAGSPSSSYTSIYLLWSVLALFVGVCGVYVALIIADKRRRTQAVKERLLDEHERLALREANELPGKKISYRELVEHVVKKESDK